MTIELFGLSGLPLSTARALLLTVMAVLWTLLLVRVVGLRSFAKMTSFDFVATVATASLIAQAGTCTRWPDYLQAMVAIGAMFLIQWTLARLRMDSRVAARLLRNEPLLLVRDGVFIEAAMRESRVSKANLLEKIRASDATGLDDVRAVILETTGDLSVLSGDRIDERLLEGVRGVDAGSPVGGLRPGVGRFPVR